MIKHIIVDCASYAITRREILDNGYLKVPGKVARTGVQYYLASELGLKDRAPNEIVGVYRPPEEVFSADSLASYDNADATNDHPADMVSADSFKMVAVGHAITPGRQEGDFVVVDLLIKDKAAIKAIEDGKVELSAGYTAEYIPQKGVTDSGEEYEFIQRNIRINHIALVDRARAGREARLYDSQPKPKEAEMKVITLDNGATVEVADNATAQLIQSTLDGLRKQANDAQKMMQKFKDEAEAEKAKAEKLDEDLEEEKKKSSDAAIAERLKSVIDSMDVARKIAGKDFTCDSVDPVEIRRAALAVARPSVAWADKSAAYIQAAWDMEAEKKEAEDEEEEESKKQAQDSLARFGKDFSSVKVNDAQAARDAAYDEFRKKRYGN